MSGTWLNLEISEEGTDILDFLAEAHGFPSGAEDSYATIIEARIKLHKIMLENSDKYFNFSDFEVENLNKYLFLLDRYRKMDKDVVNAGNTALSYLYRIYENERNVYVMDEERAEELGLEGEEANLYEALKEKYDLEALEEVLEDSEEEDKRQVEGHQPDSSDLDEDDVPESGSGVGS